MKALTVRQPWADLLVLGYKTVETRSWYTAHRGPLAIHAGLKTATPGINLAPRGCIVGVVELVECVLCDPSSVPDNQRSLGTFDGDTYLWHVRNPIAFADPIPAKGRQGLFDIDMPTDPIAVMRPIEVVRHPALIAM